MIDLALILFIGAAASIGVLVIAPLPIIYIAAFIAFTPILGIVLWRVSAALFRAHGVRGNPLSDTVVECLDEEVRRLGAKETDKTLLDEPLSPASEANSGFVDSSRDLVGMEPPRGSEAAPAQRLAAPLQRRDQRRRGGTQTPSALVDRPNSKSVELPLKRADASGVPLPPTVIRKSTWQPQKID
jgi:hypothetical protein